MTNTANPRVGALSTREAAKYLGISESLLRKTRLRDKDPSKGWRPGPKYKNIGAKVIYTVDSLDEYLSQLPTQGSGGEE